MKDKRLTQWQRVLEKLKLGSLTTMDIQQGLGGAWIPYATGVIKELRDKNYHILTEPIKGSKHCKYTLIQDGQQPLFSGEFKNVG